VKAEAANPRGDIWWGGTGDPHQQAANEGLTIEYKPANLNELYDWAQRQWQEARGRTIGIYSGALGFGYNEKLLKARGLPEPKCWADLINPAYKDEIQVADPNSSGTAYNLLATIVQIMGEEKGFAFLKALHKNVNQYTKAGAAPAQAVNLGETTIGITKATSTAHPATGYTIKSMRMTRMHSQLLARMPLKPKSPRPRENVLRSRGLERSLFNCFS